MPDGLVSTSIFKNFVEGLKKLQKMEITEEIVRKDAHAHSIKKHIDELVQKFSNSYKLDFTDARKIDNELWESKYAIETLLDEHQNFSFPLPASLRLPAKAIMNRLQNINFKKKTTKYGNLKGVTFEQLCTDKKLSAELEGAALEEEFSKETAAGKLTLTPEENKVIFDYVTQGTYTKINNSLRLGGSHSQAKILSGIINRNPLKKSLTLYRGKEQFDTFKRHRLISDSVWKQIAPDDKLEPELAKKYLTGKTLEDKGFMSTSIQKSTAMWFAGKGGSSEHIIFKISIPQGTPYWPIVQGSGEKEILLNCGTKLKVNRVEFKDNDTRMILDCQVVK